MIKLFRRVHFCNGTVVLLRIHGSYSQRTILVSLFEKHSNNSKQCAVKSRAARMFIRQNERAFIVMEDWKNPSDDGKVLMSSEQSSM